VRDAFVANFSRDDELGATVCIVAGGMRVVDLWGGYKDIARTQAWESDTLVNAYSVGKGVAATLVLTLVEQGLLDYDARVSRYWPEFAAEGKGDITLRQLISHQAGMPAVRERLPEGAMLDWSRMCRALESQAPYWAPGTRHGYHVNTFGFLIGEVVRRATGMSVGQALESYVTGPLDADFCWGLPTSQHARAAEVWLPEHHRPLRNEEEWAMAFPPTGDRERDLMIWHTYFNPGDISGLGVVNSATWREAEMPSTNGHGTARGVCGIYATLLPQAPVSTRLASPRRVDDATAIVCEGTDSILNRPSRFGLGFQLSQPQRPLGPNSGSFGHYGFGGSLGFADPTAGVAFAFLTNRPGERWQTPRTQALIDALYESLD
jgi:CubicO group peptidase (beta-lactamase class C family)